MTNNPAEFATRWAAAWNARDIEAVLEHFHRDVTFTSPTALAVVGTPTVKGKEALRAYWVKALTQMQSLHFTVERTLWEPQRRELAIIYTSETDGHRKRVSENFIFDEQGYICRAEVFHGLVPA